jgi:hypothetical protein
LPAYKKGIEFPNPDFAAFADVCGGYGFKATKPGELETAISEAFKVDGPAIIDAVVPADEMPNLSTYRPGDGRPWVVLANPIDLPSPRFRRRCAMLNNDRKIGLIEETAHNLSIGFQI